MPSMDHPTASLAALFRCYAAAIDLHPGSVDCLCEEFRRDIGMLIAKYGERAVTHALDEIQDAWPSVAVH
jgi:hypothetical protein